MKVVYYLAVCQDCLQFIANGDVSEEAPDIAESISREWDGFHLAPGDGDGEEFSRDECDGCGSHLGGARHPAVALQ